MIYDIRQQQLAHNLVNYSCRVQNGEKVWIDVSGVDTSFANLLIREVYSAGGYPFVNIKDNRVLAEILKGATTEYLDILADRDAEFMNKMDCYIGVRGGGNTYELSDVDEKIMQEYDTRYAIKVHHNIRVAKTKWVICRYPTEGMSQLAGLSTEQYENFYFDVCCLDYNKMDKAMDSLKALMDKTDRVRIVSPGTDLSFSIKDIPAVKCAGHCNIPDGEVYTAPVKDSVNGKISYNVPSIENGFKFENVYLEFENGKIIKATANDTKKCNAIFDTDDGSRFVGEFALGVNPFITKAIGDILFDEKISGSIHFTPGACYEDAPNGNKSAVHWDLVLVQTPEYGGGEIYFDDTLIRKDGLFVLDSLKCLNPENLM